MSIIDRLRDRAIPFSRRAAIIAGDRIITYGDLYDRVDRLSAALAARGLRPGDIVLAFLPNVPEAIECELATLQSGLTWVTINSRLPWPELRSVVAACEPRVLVTNRAGHETIARGQRGGHFAAMPTVVLTGTAEGHGTRGTFDAPLGYEGLLSAHSPRRPEVTIDDSDVARLRYTSGTTQHPKAAVLPHRVFQASLHNLLNELHPLSPADRTLHGAPLTHASGALVYPTLWAGGANVLMTHFDIEEALTAIEQQRITTLFTVPTMLSRLVTSPSFARRDLSSLRSLIYGGAPMPERQLRLAVERVGHALLHIYGMTEAPWPITTLRPAEHRLDNPRLGSIGKATTVCEVRIVDDTGTPVPDGQIGELQIRGRNVMSGYFRDAAATSAVLRDGWLSSGDLGRRDADGYLYIVDRKKDVIISGGFNVYAKEVEMALCEDERILEVAIVGLPDPDWGQCVAAFVVPRAGITLTTDDVERFVRNRLSSYEQPRHIEIVASLPRNSSGKVLKSAIMDRFRTDC
jgi:acyl-CoA synthetase (AMP-forming)/AMP-acid ligase II